MKKYYIITSCLLIILPTTIEPNMMANLLIQGAIGASSSLANQPITKEMNAIQKAFATNNTILLSQISTITQTQQLMQTKTLKQMQNALVGAINNIDTLLDNRSTLVKQTVEYITSMNSQQTPAQECLQQAALMDYYFTQASMNTPTIRTWKDVFRVGFWQYNPITDSFWQLHPEPWFNPTNNKAQVFQNSIFTEWTCKQNYEIRCLITIYHAVYPMFVGIMFGKNRWLSGDFDGIQRYATIGILASSQQAAAWYYAQPIVNQNQTTIYPTDALTNNQATQLSNIAAPTLSTMYDNPLEYYIALQISGSKLSYKIWQATDTEPTQYQTQTINQKANVNLFQDIGFISAGAIAEFKLIVPKECLFTPASIESFQQKLSDLIPNKGA